LAIKVAISENFPDLQLQLGVIETGDGKEVDKTKYWLCNDVEDTVEDHLSVRGDDVGTIGETPGDRLGSED
jgi:hypothetical protein